MKLYNKNELKHSRIFFDKRPPKFGTYFCFLVALILIISFYISTKLVKPYVVKAEGIVTTTDNQYISSLISGNVMEIRVAEGQTVIPGDVILVISNGQENSQSSAIVSQIATLSEKEAALTKYLHALDNGSNSLSNSGWEIEYYGKMTYYLSQVSDESKQREVNKLEITDREEKISLIELEVELVKVEIIAIEKELSSLDEVENKLDKETELTELKSNVESKESELESLAGELKQLNGQSGMGSQAETTRLQLLAEAGQAQTTLHTQRIELESQLSVYAEQDSLVEIKADNEGEVHYLTPMHIGLGIQQNQTFAEISTNGDEQKIIEVFLRSYERSKVKVGQDVKINVQGVNSTQYGMLKGSIVSIDNGTITQETSNGNQSYYRIRIVSDNYILKGGDADDTIDVLKSMPVQAQIVYEEETYFMWILEMLNLIS